MDLMKKRSFVKTLVLVFVLIFFSGVLSACSSGSSSVQADPAKEKSWNKMVWNTGKWG